MGGCPAVGGCPGVGGHPGEIGHSGEGSAAGRWHADLPLSGRQPASTELLTVSGRRGSPAPIASRPRPLHIWHTRLGSGPLSVMGRRVRGLPAWPAAVPLSQLAERRVRLAGRLAVSRKVGQNPDSVPEPRTPIRWRRALVTTRRPGCGGLATGRAAVRAGGGGGPDLAGAVGPRTLSSRSSTHRPLVAAVTVGNDGDRGRRSPQDAGGPRRGERFVKKVHVLP